MLIALELAGFKSFADKTRFDFPDGITVVVGPNGSGKSNVVDAIKWVLGSQSAKALRGKEMADVIFKGSSGSGRKPANSAEATLFFDNSNQALSIEAQEVQVTRRVYRSGESEYLINGQPSRLKDIKSLFRGTGVGVDAYSIIEQGKVDRLLQASPKDRRLIFEEAAGISHFNAKKEEAQRRLLRVDQNLVRLKDIVDEVHTRLTTLKSQAGKAQEYREMTQRLHEIRLRISWTEYCEIQSRLHAANERLEQLQQQQQSQEADLAQTRQVAQSAEMELHQVADQCQTVETVMQSAVQRIAVANQQQLSHSQRIDETQIEWQRQSLKLLTLLQRAEKVRIELDAAVATFQAAQNEFEQTNQRVLSAEQQVQQLRDQIAQRAARHDQLRKQHVQLLRQVSDRASQIAHQKNLLSQLVQEIQDTELLLHQQVTNEQSARRSAERAAVRLKDLHQQNQQTIDQLNQAKQELEENRTALANHQEQAGVLQGKLAGANERLEILLELQRHGEGVDAGARHLLKMQSESTDPALQSIYGLVADLIGVDVNLAPLIDTALGNTANALVLRDGQIVQQACSGGLSVPGRLTLMRLDRIPAARFAEKVQLDGVQGVIGRADRLVRFRREVQQLMRYLLGTTWLVENLEVALELGHFRGAGLRFVTADCQLIEADGTITLGSFSASSGLVSRHSQIRDAQQEIAQLKLRFQKVQGEIERVQGRLQNLRPSVDQLDTQARSLAQEFAHQQATAQSSVAKLDEIEHQAATLTASLSELRKRHTEFEPTIAGLQADVDQWEQSIAQIESELTSQESLLTDQEAQYTTASADNLAAKVELARCEQRLESVTSVLDQCRRDSLERQLAVSEVQRELLRLHERSQTIELESLQLTIQLAEDHLQAESEEAKLEILAQQAKELRERRGAYAKRVDALARANDKLSQQIENSLQEQQRCQQSSQTLLQRCADDYQIDFQYLQTAQPIQDDVELSSMNAEATRLRHDISSVGEINMAALAELDQLQQRYDHLHTQYQDLQAAKESLQRVIHKINGDSRRMFQETLEAIRQNFQKLYRKSFGGGHADIILEEGQDILESGIDIVATPPGKTAFSNSLLSGGEKALTAVALLLAIFQYRPSPFCVLDEVDAPFDEANVGRFVGVLTEFLDWTKFIIVTHSKKTMTAATTLYGVTMQESGVSKQVAVRFEDVNEKGEIVRGPYHEQRKAA
jgi:chromosome segregation protein